ncbi:hypothetical protein CEXT_259131 [Caerostris extrusa]|uniref:Uncharacterized protein n=1 Tax=Caerostris extrusa TaxID=172846 RepID=A0AAV4YAG8_CAEEX|nr:hypothetical protein CEXT_259131 [Caerostris extrusa]
MYKSTFSHPKCKNVEVILNPPIRSTCLNNFLPPSPTLEFCLQLDCQSHVKASAPDIRLIPHECLRRDPLLVWIGGGN